MSALLVASFQAAVLAGVVLLAERLAGGWLSPRLRSALWGLVLLRLALPVSIADPLGAARPAWWTRPLAGWTGAAAEVEPSAVGVREAPARAPALKNRPEPAPQEDPAPPRDPAARGGLVSLGLDAPASTPDPTAATVGAHHPTAPNPSPRPSPWAVAWLAGALLLLVRTTLGEVRFRRRLRREGRPAGPRLRAAARECASRLGFGRPPEVLIVPGLPSPAAHGLLRGRLLLPDACADQLDDDALRFVLLHELTHLRHRDGLANLGLAVLQALHWFNPAAHLAAARLRAEREVLRDREAAAALPELTARRCAETLLALLPRQRPASPQMSLSAILPHRRTLQHRIAMILRTRPATRFQSAAGLTAFALLAWAGLTHSPQPAEPPTGAPALQEAATAEPLIRVTREREPSSEESALRAQLSAEVSWTEPLSLPAFAAHLHLQTQVPVHMTPTLLEDGRTIAPLRVALPAERALDLLGATAWLRWSVDERGLLLESRDESPQQIELRFYDVRPLLDGDPDRADWLIDLLEGMTEGNGTWDWDEVGMQYWNGQLLVRQSPRDHDTVHALLELIARGSSGPLAPMPAAHRTALRAPATFAEGDVVGDALGKRLAEHGIALFGAPEILEEEFDRGFEGRPLEEVLHRVASDWGMPVVYDAGVIVVGFEAPLEVRAHPVGDLLDGDPDVRDRLAELVVDMTGEDHWDVEYAGVEFWGETMLVRQYRGIHLAVERFLETARRAVRQ